MANNQGFQYSLHLLVLQKLFVNEFAMTQSMQLRFLEPAFGRTAEEWKARSIE